MHLMIKGVPKYCIAEFYKFLAKKLTVRSAPEKMSWFSPPNLIFGSAVRHFDSITDLILPVTVLYVPTSIFVVT